MTSPKIQKDIVSPYAQETVKAIIDDLGGDYFGILVDEFKNISYHEQMALALRYVDKKGQVNEPFIGLVRVGDTSAKSLREAIYSLLLKHSLSPSKICGQGYDGASNMQGKVNGLKALILEQTPSVYCIHYFAHQLQLTLVAVAKKHKKVETFFVIIANVLNVVGESFKRRDQLRDHQAELLEKLLESGELQSVLMMSNELSKALQKKEQDIVNAMVFLDLTKERLQVMREDGWVSLMDDVSSFCAKHDIVDLNSHFDVVSGNFLLGMANLNPVNSFANFDKEKIMTLAKYYPNEFGELKL
nr:zinc finger MYM-type protein 1-like [Nicotiana tomentosiformis]